MPDKKPKMAPKHYRILWALMADPNLSASAKCVATALLLKFRNSKTGVCNPSFDAIAKVLGRKRRTVIDAVAELKAEPSSWLRVRGTKGGSKTNTNHFEFSMPKATGAADCTRTGAEDRTGAAEGSTGAADRTPGVQCNAHELSLELSKNYSAEPSDDAGQSIPSWARSIGGGKYFVLVDSEGGDLIARYCEANKLIFPMVSPRENAFIVPYIWPPGTSPTEIDLPITDGAAA